MQTIIDGFRIKKKINWDAKPFSVDKLQLRSQNIIELDLYNYINIKSWRNNDMALGVHVKDIGPYKIKCIKLRKRVELRLLK